MLCSIPRTGSENDYLFHVLVCFHWFVHRVAKKDKEALPYRGWHSTKYDWYYTSKSKRLNPTEGMSQTSECILPLLQLSAAI